jgi:hypothetical protein
MAGFARCSRCDRVLTSLHVEDVPALGALPAAFRILVVACSNCRAALGTSIIGPARTDTRSRFHDASTPAPWATSMSGASRLHSCARPLWPARKTARERRAIR